MPVNLVQRQGNLIGRIASGVNKGQLTADEGKALRQQVRTERQEIVTNRQDGPGLTFPEYAKSQMDLLQIGGEVRQLRRN
ncbi:MAG: hypothetical protein FJY99_13600 [Candidatus Sericytochromatia bacterium]|nr:hypothetical protein [Candidatus Tanganyikabacteria bacterium]